MQAWNNIYDTFSPVAFSIFGFNVYWYSLCYAAILLGWLISAIYFIKKFSLPVQPLMFGLLFIWAELGVVIGARVTDVIVYSPNTAYYLTHPWQIFNPFANGKFTGIRGMSYHGGVIGFIIAVILFCKKYKQDFWLYSDICALSGAFVYFLGRIGNFLNKELFGKVTDLQNTPWAIIVNGQVRHPSQLYEAFLEGICVFIALLFLRKFTKVYGELFAYYIMLYAAARIICEFFREPDLLFLGISVGQLLSFAMFIAGFAIFVYLRKFKRYHPIA